MSVDLKKGGNVSLEKEAGVKLNQITVGLGWDERKTDGADFDLDAIAFLCGKDGKVVNDKSFIFYNNLKSVDGTVVHAGDNLTGDGDGDDEQIAINLSQISEDIEKIAVCVTIHDAEERKQNFGMVENASVRIVNTENDKEIVHFDLTEDMSTETAVIFAELYKKDGVWKFKAIGQGFAGGLKPLALNFGVSV